MSPLRSLALVLSAALLLPGCSRHKGESNSGSLLFDHAKHVENADCGDCHEGVEKDTGGASGRFIPGKKKCGDCHEDELKSKCSLCHRGAKEGVRFERRGRRLRFSHAAHTGRVKACKTCHASGAKVAELAPGHKTCNTSGCHAKDHKQLACRRCHEDLRRYARRPGRGLSHGPGFARNHGPLARQATRACAQCHDQTYCAECHGRTSTARASILFPEKIDRSFIHRGDYQTRHVVDARANPASCRRCHGQQHCRSCHALSGLATSTHAKLRGGKTGRAHPSGWTMPGAAAFHGHQARRDIGRCASCHDRGAKSICIGCHQVGGIGGNPHPPGWGWRDKAVQCKTNSMCSSCHVGGKGCR